METKNIERTKLKPDPNQPRKTFELDSLKKSIEKQGVITPLIVTPPTNGKYEIIDGERRWKASKGVMDKLPCVVIDRDEYNEPDKRLELQLVIDEMREDFNVIDRAEAYQRYIDAGHSQAELARLLGKSKDPVRKVLSLLSLRSDIKDTLKENDANWSYHSEVEADLSSDVPKIQKHRIHKRIQEGAFDTRDQLRETLKFARAHPVKTEEISKAKDQMERERIVAETEVEERDEKFDNRKTEKKEITQDDLDRERLTDMLRALNQIRGERIEHWSYKDTVEFIDRAADKKMKKAMTEAIEREIDAWRTILKKLKK